MHPNLLVLLGVTHGHLQRIALAPGASALLEVFHHLLIPRLQTRRELALGGTFACHFYKGAREFTGWLTDY